MVESALGIDETHCGRVNLQVAVRLHDGNRAFRGQWRRFSSVQRWSVVLEDRRLQNTIDPLAFS